MRRVHNSLSGVLVLVAVSAACVDGSESSPTAWSVSRGALLGPDLVRACLSLYVGSPDCEVLRVSAVPGLYESQIALDGSGDSLASTLFSVREGTYTTAVWGMDSQGRAVGFGCGGKVEVSRGGRAEIDIEVQPNRLADRGAPCPLPGGN